MSATVCLVSYKYFPEWGGLARSASRLVNSLINFGYDVHVITPSFSVRDCSTSSLDIYNSIDAPQIGENGERIYRPIISDESELMGELFEFLLILDRKIKFDIFHGYYLPYAFPCVMLAANGDRPVIASIRGNDAVKEGVSPKYFPYVKTVLERSRWITSVASDLLVNMMGVMDISDKSSVISNGIDAKGFPKWKGFDVTQGVVGTIGELRLKKSISLLVKAYARMGASGRKNLILGGVYTDKSEERAVYDVIMNENLEHEIIHTGYLPRDQLLITATNFNMFILNSYHDGMPNTLLEAAACGLPIIASNVGGMRDVLVDGENALLIDPGSIDQLLSAMSRVGTDRVLCNKLSSGALQLADRLNFQQESESWKNLYKNLLL